MRRSSWASDRPSAVFLQKLFDPSDFVQFYLHSLPAGVVHHTKATAQARQAAVGIVAAKREPIFGPAGEHAIRLIDATGDEVVDHHTQIGVFAAQHERFFTLQAQHGVRARQKPLPARLFIAGGAVDLSGEIEPGHALGFQRDFQLFRRSVVVFDRVAVADDLCTGQAGDHADHRVLHFARQARGKAIDVDLVRSPAFRSRNN